MKRYLLIFLFSLLLLRLSGVYGLFRMSMKLYVDPEKSVVWVGSTFMVNVSVADVLDPGLWGYEFKLYYNNTLLEGLNVTLPEDHFLTPENPQNIWIQCEVNQTGGYLYLAVTLGGDEPTKLGNGTLVTITFKARSLGSSTLDFRDCIFVSAFSGSGDEEHTIRNGIVEVVPPEDLNLDGEINIKDLALVGSAFGSYPGHPRWNPTADINKDLIINIIDVTITAKNFGKTL